MAEHSTYKGMDFSIEYEDEDHAEVTIGDRTFGLRRHGEGDTIRLWSCDESYFVSDDLYDVVRHLIDYWYIITDPNTAPPEGPAHGELPERPGGVIPAHGHEGHVHRDEPGEKKGAGGGTRGRRTRSKGG